MTEDEKKLRAEMKELQRQTEIALLFQDKCIGMHKGMRRTLDTHEWVRTSAGLPEDTNSPTED